LIISAIGPDGTLMLTAVDRPVTNSQGKAEPATELSA
jgi:hypothetical protein